MKQYTNDPDTPKTDQPTSVPRFVYSTVRNDAIEEAAKVCEQVDKEGSGPDCWDWHSKDYAKAIRALKK